MSARRCRWNTCRLSWLVNKMSFSADVCGYKGCPMFSSIISHHPSLYPQLKGFYLHDSSSEWNRSWLLDFTFNAISSGYTVWRWPCSIMLIYSFVLIRQHDHQRPNKRMLVQSYSLYLSQQRWSLKGIKLMIMQKVELLHYVFTCKLPDSGHLILINESCLVPPIQPFPFTRTYLRAYNFVKKFASWKKKKNLHSKLYKMQNVCVLSAFQRTCFGSMSHMYHCWISAVAVLFQ